MFKCSPFQRFSIETSFGFVISVRTYKITLVRTTLSRTLFFLLSFIQLEINLTQLLPVLYETLAFFVCVSATSDINLLGSGWSLKWMQIMMVIWFGMAFVLHIARAMELMLFDLRTCSLNSNTSVVCAWFCVNAHLI